MLTNLLPFGIIKIIQLSYAFHSNTDSDFLSCIPFKKRAGKPFPTKKLM